jgi:hypothetical protein
MFAPRLIGTTAATLIGALGLFGAAQGVSAGAPDTSAPPTTSPTTSPPSVAVSTGVPATVIPCEIVDSDVEGGYATFTVGPEGCSGEVGPISFSTYDLPNGQIMPYEDQVLIAHAEGNGAMYAAGTYTLTASLGAALNWQADLYFGMSDDQPPHPNMIDVDALTGVVPATTEAPTTTSTTTTTTTTPAPAPIVVPAPNVVVNVTTPAQASAGPTVPVAPENESANASAVAVVNESPQVAAQAGTTTTTTTTPQTLPETGSGSSTPLLLTTGGALSFVGLAARRLARRH